MRGNTALEKAVLAALSPALTDSGPGDLHFTWWCAKQTLFGIALHLRPGASSVSHGALPEGFFLRITPNLEEHRFQEGAWNVLEALKDSPCKMHIEVPVVRTQLSGFGHLFAAPYFDGEIWNPIGIRANSDATDRYRSLVQFLDMLGSVPASRFEDMNLLERHADLTPLMAAASDENLSWWKEITGKLETQLSVFPLALSHGDFALNNVLWGKGTFRVIDWERAHLSYPGRDLLSLRMNWLLLTAGRVRLRKLEDWAVLLLGEHEGDLFLPALAGITPHWQEVRRYFTLTREIKWICDCVDSTVDWIGVFRRVIEKTA